MKVKCRSPAASGGGTLDMKVKRRSPAASPGLLNRLSPLMPTRTFIPISMTFKSIQDARKTPTEVSQNLLSTFNEASIKSPQPSQIVIKPTPVEIRISDVDEDIGLMINEEIQTDTTCVEDMQVQTAPQEGESKEVQTNWVATDVCNQIIQTEVAATEQETQTENPSTQQETNRSHSH